MVDGLRESLSGSRLGRGIARRALLGVALTAGVGVLGLSPGASGADVVHSGCTAVAAGGSSGWCGLYPGNATSNVQELGMVTVSADGSTIVVQTQSASSGVDPATSFACLLSTPASQITHRLQDTLCTSAGGVWLPFVGGSLTISMSQYPQFANTSFTIQVAANKSANDSNGDSFYNNVTVSTAGSGGAT